MKNEIKKEIDILQQKLKEWNKINIALFLYVTIVPFSFLLFIVWIICKGG